MSGAVGRPQLMLGHHGNISTRKLETGKWRATTKFRHPITGVVRVITRSGASKTKALAALQQELDAARGASGKGGAMTIAELCELYSKQMTQAIQTRARYRATIKNTILPRIGQIRLRELDKSKLVAFIKTVPTPSEKRTARAVLAGAFQLAMELGAVKENPAIHTGIRIDDSGRKKTRALDFDGVQAVLDLIAAHAHKPRKGGPKTRKLHTDLGELFLIQLAANGIRVGEAAAIRDTDVDREAGTVFIHATVVYQEVEKDAAGSIIVPPGYIVQENTKAKDRVIIRLPEYALRILARRMEDPGEGGLLFHTGPWKGSVGRPLNLNNTRRTLRACLEDTDYQWVSTHSARRTLGTIAERDPEFGLDGAQGLLRHKHRATTQGYVEPNLLAPDGRRITERFGR